MSADNGIYILRTYKPDTEQQEYEYRVAHLQAIDNLEWDDDKQSYIIQNVRVMFRGCKVFDNALAATLEAKRLYKEIRFLEYGINFIEIDREF